MANQMGPSLFLATIACAVLGLGACVVGVEPINPNGSTPGDTGDGFGSGVGGSGAGNGFGNPTSSSTSSGSGTVGAGGASSTAGSGGADPAGSTTGSGGPVTGSVVLEYQVNGVSPQNSSVNPMMKLVNNGSSEIQLSEITIRYWYTIDSAAATQEFACDWAMIGCGLLSAAFTPTTGTDADHYLEVAFNSGSLAPNSDTGPLQLRFNKGDWTNFDETNDYSYDESKTSYTSWDKITVYQNGTLIWGQEP